MFAGIFASSSLHSLRSAHSRFSWSEQVQAGDSKHVHAAETVLLILYGFVWAKILTLYKQMQPPCIFLPVSETHLHISSIEASNQTVEFIM